VRIVNSFEKLAQLRIIKISNVVSLIAVFTVNALANALPLNGKGTGEISDSYPDLFAPSGLTFAIWGVIYFLLALFAIEQFTLEKAQEDVAKIGWLFTASNLANFAWIFSWHWEVIELSLVFMLILLGCLLAIYLRLNPGKQEPELSFKVRNLSMYVPFSVYLGWITVATIANVTTLLVDVGWNGWGISNSAWAIIVIIVGTLIGLGVLFTKGDLGYGAVIVWSFAGIAIKRLDPEIGSNPEVGYVAIAGATVIFAYWMYLLVKAAKK